MKGKKRKSQPATSEEATFWLPLRLAEAYPEEDEDEEPGAGGDGSVEEEEEGASKRREYRVQLIAAGFVKMANGQDSTWRIPPETIQAAVEAGLFEGIAVFVDHPGWFEHPSVKNLIGLVHSVEYDAKLGAAMGTVRLYDIPLGQCVASLLDQFLADGVAGEPVPNLGGSLTFFGKHDFVDESEPDEEERYVRVTKEIYHVLSWDLVFGPGAEGRVKEALQMVQSLSVQGSEFNPEPGTLNSELLGRRGDLPMEPNESEQVRTSGAQHTHTAQVLTAPDPAPALAPAPQVQIVGDTSALAALNVQVASLREQVDRLTGALAAQEDPQVVTGMGVAPRQPGGRVQGGLNSLDQIALAYDQLMSLPVSGQVHRLSGIRELYFLLTGDRELRGEFNPDLIPSFLAYNSAGNNADTTTMAELTRNVMAKVLVQQMDILQEYYWWKRIVRTENMNSLQQVSWVRYGGIGYDTGTGLPTVAEKGEYVQLLWEDARTTGDWVKKGGYLPLSLEMIDRDDLMGWRDVPRQLALAQAVTLSSVISALFTDNSGAGADLADSIGDGFAFNTTRGNLITQPLDPTNWNTVIDTMYKLAQLKNSTQTENRRQAVRPAYVLVPIELEAQGVTSVTSPVKPGTFADRVPVKRLLSEDRVIAVPDWTNTDNWAALADPNLVAFAGVAFRFGDTPEIFMPGKDNHILWLNDVLPIKTRWFFSVAVVDTRGAIKSNLS